MGWTDAQGRPEIVMHPDIVRGAAAYRIVDEPPPGASADRRGRAARPAGEAIRLRQALKLVMDLLGRPPDDPSGPWRLVTFPGGWLVLETSHGGAAPAVRVVERDTGQILRFPPDVTADQLRGDYPQLAGRASVETQPAGARPPATRRS